MEDNQLEIRQLEISQLEKLSDRSVLYVSGADAKTLLQRILTANFDMIEKNAVHDCALLTPQGKLDFQMLVSAYDAGYLLDMPSQYTADLATKLRLYKLRADVNIEDMDDLAVLASNQPNEHAKLIDTRAPDMGYRGYVRKDTASSIASVTNKAETQYEARRIAAGLPQISKDFERAQCFVHEALLDQTGGVDFSKGCYVGQEVVSRVEHRSIARKRFLKVRSDASLPALGEDLFKNNKKIGTMGSSIGKNGLALIRRDKVQSDVIFDANGQSLKLSLPNFVNFSLLSRTEDD